MCHYLEAQGIRCWYAPRNIRPSDNWAAAIMDAIGNARVCVLLFSGASNESPQVHNEVSNAFNARRVIIPVRLDETQMCPELAYYLSRVHWLDVSNSFREAKLDELYRLIDSILSGDSQPPAPPPPPPPPPPKFLWKILIAVMLLVLAVSGVLFIWDRIPQKAKFFCVSHNGTASYPGTHNYMMSSDKSQIMLRDRENGILTVRDIARPYEVLWSMEYEFSDPLTAAVLFNDTNDFVYIIEPSDNTFSVYNRNKKTWITESQQIDIFSDSEYMASYVFRIPNIQVDRATTEVVTVLTIDESLDMECYCQMIHFRADGSWSVIDVSALELVDIICLFDGFSEYALVRNATGSVLILNLENGQIVETDLNTIFEEYMPNAMGKDSILSQDHRYYIQRRYSDDGAETVCIWDLKTGDPAFTSHSSVFHDIQFSGSQEILYFDHGTNEFYKRNLETDKRTTTVLDAEFFEKSKHFLDEIYLVRYSQELDLYFFLSREEKSLGNKFIFQLTAVDPSGKVLAKSDRIEMEHGYAVPDIEITEESVYFLLGSLDDTWPICYEEYTAVYRALYTVDEKGNLVFSDGYHG